MSKALKMALIISIVAAVSMSTTAYASKKMNVVAETNDRTRVQSFTDNGNRCYIIERVTKRDFMKNGSPSNSVAISCVRER